MFIKVQIKNLYLFKKILNNILSLYTIDIFLIDNKLYMRKYIGNNSLIFYDNEIDLVDNLNHIGIKRFNNIYKKDIHFLNTMLNLDDKLEIVFGMELYFIINNKNFFSINCDGETDKYRDMFKEGIVREYIKYFCDNIKSLKEKCIDHIHRNKYPDKILNKSLNRDLRKFFDI